MKVLIVAYADYPGGMAASNHVQRYALGLQMAGDEVTVVGHQFDPAKPVSGVDSRGVRFTSFHIRRRPKFLPAYAWTIASFRRGVVRTLKELLSRERYDVLIYEGRSWLVGRALWTIARRNGIAVFPYPLEWHRATLVRWLAGSQTDNALFRSRLIPRSDGVIGISRFWEQWSRERGVPSVVIPGFADVLPGARPSEPTAAAKPFKVVFVGTWQPRELPRTMFEGLQQAIDRGVDLQLVVVGRVGRHRDEQEAVRALEALPELKRRTVLTGWVSDEQLAEHQRTAGAFVLLREDDRETRALFPTRLPEYLLSANPVILSDAGDLPYYLRHRESAWVIPPGHAPAELADAVCHLASDESERRRIGLGGWRVAADVLSLEHLGRKMHDFMQSVIAAAQPRT